MRGLSSIFAVAAISAAGACEYWPTAIQDVIPGTPHGNTTTRGGGMSVAQSKRAALKLRRRKSHRMHCRGRKS